MPKAPLLDAEEVTRALVELPGWQRAAEMLVKPFSFKNFVDALAFVNRIAEPAEAMNHHPDVKIHWNEVTLELWTHASGGITQKDIDLARAIEERATP
jgi:4a-hydroxytetrahydrobiopterin dehydratase